MIGLRIGEGRLVGAVLLALAGSAVASFGLVAEPAEWSPRLMRGVFLPAILGFSSFTVGRLVPRRWTVALFCATGPLLLVLPQARFTLAHGAPWPEGLWFLIVGTPLFCTLCGWLGAKTATGPDAPPRR